MYLTENLLIRIPAVFIALTFHEAAHGWVAWRLGDPTAKARGRITLNPLAHLDPLGLLALWLVGFGWAKPIPVNPLNFRGDRYLGMLLVGLAGPVTNFIVAFVILFLLAMVPVLQNVPYLTDIMVAAFLINVYLGVFNLIPIPPLDGSRALLYFLPQPLRNGFIQLERIGPLLLLLLIFLPFGILPRVVLPAANLIIDMLSRAVLLISELF